MKSLYYLMNHIQVIRSIHRFDLHSSQSCRESLPNDCHNHHGYCLNQVFGQNQNKVLT